MINIIKEILEATGFVVESEVNFASNNKKSMNYVFRNYNNINEFIEKIYNEQNELYDYISSLKKGNEIKKNTSFIILVKINGENEKNKILDEILELEEDKYFFKKYVITYTENEYISLCEKKDGLNIIEFMETSLNDYSEFEKFKVNNKFSYYSLILKFYIKFPHLKCGHIFKNGNVMNLSKQIEEEIERTLGNEVLEYNKKIIELEVQEIDKYIENLLECEDKDV